MSQKAAEVGAKWYQSKRIPLYAVVAGGLSGAAYFLSARSSHPLVEQDKEIRKDPIPQLKEGSEAAGHAQHESVGRRTTRSMGLHGQEEGPQSSDGIMRNKKSHELLSDTPLDFTKDKAVTKPKV